MAAPVTALDRDVRALAGMVSDYRADVPAQGLPTSLRSELEDQIGCDSVLSGSGTGSRSRSPLTTTPGMRDSCARTRSITGTASHAATRPDR